MANINFDAPSETNRDIWLGNIPLNDWNDSLICMVEKVTGWWGPPEAEIPSDARPYTEDGNYTVAGRYASRLVEIEGCVIPVRGNTEEGMRDVVRWRDNFVNSLNLVRNTTRLIFFENSGTKYLDVQITGRPDISFDKNNILKYNIQLLAQDPKKYNINLSKRIIAVTKTPSDFFNTPGAQIYEALKFSSSGRTYRDINVGNNTYAVFPRRYNKTNLAYDNKTEQFMSQISIYNEGDSATTGTIYIKPPVINPVVLCVEQRRFLKLNYTSTTNNIEINLKDKVITSGSENITYNLTPESSWFVFNPGITTLSFYADDVKLPVEGWAAAVNYTKNPSMEYGNNPMQAFFTDGFYYSKITAIGEKKQADSLSVKIDNSSATGSAFPGAKTTHNCTAEMSPWFGDRFMSDEKAVAIKPTAPGSYIELESTVNPGDTIAFSAKLAGTFYGAPTGISRSIVLKYRHNDDDFAIIRPANKDGFARIIHNIPKGAVNPQLFIYNGYGPIADLDQIDDTYKIFSNTLFVKDIRVSHSIEEEYNGNSVLLPDLTAVVNKEDKNTFNLMFNKKGTFLIDKNSYVNTFKNKTFTFRCTVVPTVDGTVTIAVDPADDSIAKQNISHPTVNVKSNLENEVRIIMEHPNYDTKITLMCETNTIDPEVTDSFVIKNMNIFEGAYRGLGINSETIGMSDSITLLNQEDHLTVNKTIPRGYENVGFSLENTSGIDTFPLSMSRSSEYKQTGNYSIKISSPPSSYTSQNLVSAAKVTCIDFASFPGGNTTVRARCLASGTQFVNSQYSCAIVIKHGDDVYVSQQASPNTEVELSLTYNHTPGKKTEMFLVGGSLGQSSVYFDDILFVAGEYKDRYFHGGMENVTWAGDAHNSISNQTAKETVLGSTTEVIFRDAWIL